MNTHGNFVPLETVDPEMARKFPPGVHFFVSALTFAEAAEAVDKALETQPVVLPSRDAQPTDLVAG